MLGVTFLDNYLIKNGDIKVFKIQLLRDKLPFAIEEGCSVTFRVSNKKGNVYEYPMEIIDASKGIVHIKFKADIGKGTFYTEYVLSNDEGTIHLTFPDNGYETFVISESLNKKFS